VESFGWYPTRAEAFATRADFELNFQFPKKYSLVATGDKLSEGLEGDVALSRWKSGIPLAVAGFAYGDWFFNQYVYGTGIPGYRFTYQVEDAGSGKWQVKGRIVQANCSTGLEECAPGLPDHVGPHCGNRLDARNRYGKLTLVHSPNETRQDRLNQNEEILADVKQ
jgi:hypothetical protein